METYYAVVYHNGMKIKAGLSYNNTQIFDSYKVRKKRDMEEVIQKIRQASDIPALAVRRRTVKGMVHEWKAHNLLYELGIARDRTKDVDLDIGNPWYKVLGYRILSIPYTLFF
jgi:hypothetical protein|uniref:Uncharacterized protein n=1 Tax=Podoviridae sp. ctz6O13 TaxID=2827757 RepID=A0A8S5TLW3_9CAUD|nr:MAG TPA: hypothetical protein [Podoviridae sp. ctz6O13]